MRALFVVVSLSLMTARSEACPPTDFTYVRGSYLDLMHEEPRHGPVAPNPRLFFHLGECSRPGLPEFFSDDGSPIPATYHLVDQVLSIFQVDLEIDSGRILVRHPGELDVTETFVIDPTFAPSTRGVRVRESWLEIDSDAVMFRLEADGRRETWFNLRLAPFFDRHTSVRVTALYSDRREEVIFDYRLARPIGYARPIGPAVLAVLLLMLATVAGLRFRSTTSSKTVAV